MHVKTETTIIIRLTESQAVKLCAHANSIAELATEDHGVIDAIIVEDWDRALLTKLHNKLFDAIHNC